MVTGKQLFTFIDKQVGVTQNGEKYLAINVLTKGNEKKKVSFLSKNDDLVSKYSNVKFNDFQDIELSLQFDRVYNSEKRFSYWDCELIGIGTGNSQFANSIK